MKKILFFILTLATGIFIGAFGLEYYENHQTEDINRLRSKLTPIDSLKSKVWNGDVEAYAKLQGEYRDYPPENFLFWAMFMANKYNYVPAYTDVFSTLQDSYYYSDSAIFKMDDSIRTFALGYLKKGAQKGDSNAVKELEAMKNRNVPEEWLR